MIHRPLRFTLLAVLALAALFATGCGKQGADSSATASADSAAAALSANTAQSSAGTAAGAVESYSKPLAGTTPPPRKPRPPAQKPAEPAPPRETHPSYVTLQAGSHAEIALTDSLSSETSKEGDTFSAELTGDWMAGNLLALPRGTRVLGHLCAAEATGRGKKKAFLVLCYDKLGLPDGTTLAISAKPDSFEAKGNTKGDVTRVGAGALIGGLIGKLTGNTERGVAIGAVAGAGAALANKGDHVGLAAGHRLTLLLTEPVSVPMKKSRS